MNILVTGGAGFIGSNLANRLHQDGHKVVVLDNLQLGKTENIIPEITFVQGNVESMDDLKQCGDRFDTIVHLAAASSAPMFQADLIGSYRNNVLGFLSVLEYARAIHCQKVLYASTSSIYGNNPVPLTEDQHVVPLNYYAVTKHAMEETANVFAAQHGMDIIGFRFMSVYGPNEKHKGQFANLVAQFIWDIAADRSPVLYGDGLQERDFTNVKDIVQAINLAILSEKRFGSTIFNIGTSESVNLVDLVQMINAAFGKNMSPEHIENPVKEGYVRSQLGSIEKISRELGYQPSVSLQDGIQELVQAILNAQS